MELVQHMLVHSLALINNGHNIEKIKQQFEEGTEFCMQTMVDILQLQVNPKSKKPTHFTDNFYSIYGIANNQVYLTEYYFDSQKESMNIHYKTDFNKLFTYNKNINLDLLKYICEHLVIDKMTDDMFFIRLANITNNNEIISLETNEIFDINQFNDIKKYLYIVISRKYLSKIKKYGITMDNNIIENWCKSMRKIFREDCITGENYLKNNLIKVFDYNSYPDNLLLSKIKNFISEYVLDKELELQEKICCNIIKQIWESKNFDELKDNVLMLIKENYSNDKKINF